MELTNREELLRSLTVYAAEYLEKNGLEVCGNLVILANQDIAAEGKIIQSKVTLREVIHLAILRYYDENSVRNAIDFLNSFANGFMQDISGKVNSVESIRKINKYGLGDDVLPNYAFDVTLSKTDDEISIQTLPLPEVWLAYQEHQELPFTEELGVDLDVGRDMYNDLVVMLHDEYFTGHTYLPFLPRQDINHFNDLIVKKIIEDLESKGNVYFQRFELKFANKEKVRDINTLATEALLSFPDCPLTSLKGNSYVAAELIKEIERRLPSGFTLLPSQKERFSHVGHQTFDWTNLSIYVWKDDAINFAQIPFVSAYAMTHIYPFVKFKTDGVSFNTIHFYNQVMDNIERQVNDYFDPIYKQLCQEEFEANEKARLEAEEKKKIEVEGKDLSEYLKKPKDVPLAVVEQGPGNSLLYSAPKEEEDEFGNLDNIDFDVVAKKVDTMQSGGGEILEPSNKCEGGGCEI